MSEVSLKVSLINHTPDPEETIVTAASLCYSGSSIKDLITQNTKYKKEGVLKKAVNKIRMLKEKKHLSPLEHASFTFGIEGISRACSHQLVRHRIASYAQQSQRYVSMEEFNYIIPRSVETSKNLTHSFKDEEGDNIDGEVSGDFWYSTVMSQINQWYTQLIQAGVPAEDARYVLPNACETKIIVTMNARELLHFFTIRCCNCAQWEIKEMAIEMLRLCKSIVPIVFEDAGPECVRTGCQEGNKSCGKPQKVKEYFMNLREKLEE